MNTATRIIKTATISSAFGAAVLAAPAAHAASSAPSMDVTLDAKVTSGNTVAVTYEDKGVQHLFSDAGTTYASATSGGYDIDFGDGSPRAGGNGMGGSQCTTQGSAPFHTTTGARPISHTYAKPGTYTIRAVSSFCGNKGEEHRNAMAVVTVGADGSGKPAPGDSQAPHVDPHIRYTVKGNTAAITSYLTGTQRPLTALGQPADDAQSSLPLNFSVTLPKGAKQVGGNLAGDGGVTGCATTGSVKVSSEALGGGPLSVTFPGPGTYPVTLTSDVCTDQKTVKKTVIITIPKAGSGVTSGSSDATNGSTGTSTGSDGSKPATGTSTDATGPRVQTDNSGTQTLATWGFVGLAGAGALGGAGLVAARRRHTQR